RWPKGGLLLRRPQCSPGRSQGPQIGPKHGPSHHRKVQRGQHLVIVVRSRTVCMSPALVMANVRVIIKNTFFEVESSIDEPFAAPDSGTRRVQSCPPIRGKDEDEIVFSEDGSGGSRLKHTESRSDASRSLSLIIRADPAVVYEEPEEDALSCCSIDHYWCWQSSHTPLVHADLTGKVGESPSACKQSGQASASPSARTPLSSKAGSFTPTGCNAAVLVPGCPQTVGAFCRASSSAGQWPDPDIQHLRTDSMQTTTLIMKYIPFGVTRDELIDVINGQGFDGAYDDVYLPRDPKTYQGKGYAFVNFLSQELAYSFRGAFSGFTQWPIRCIWLCTVEWSKSQRFQVHVDHCSNHTVMGDHMPD
ncbi:unnamed protein product, partial [Prorocentrum cordatum]